jgi:dCTP deaminase
VTRLSLLILVMLNGRRSDTRLVAVLSDGDIRRYRAKGELRIEPFDEANLTPNGYDVTIEEVLVPSSNARTTRGVAKVPPMTRFAVSTRESVNLGRHVAGQIWLRTTWARRGVLAAFGMIDAGFSGTLTFGALNAASEVLEVPIGERFAQIVFLSLESPSSETYEKRSGTYQGQRGVTLERP